MTNSNKNSAVKSWQEIENDLKTLFSVKEQDLNKRCKLWQQVFQPLFPNHQLQYCKYDWRKKAFNVSDKKTVDWDNYSMEKMSKLQYPGNSEFLNSDFVKFHKAARIQRHLVTENIS